VERADASGGDILSKKKPGAGADAAASPRAALAGGWRLSREIDDRRAGATGRFEGVATFVPDGAGLVYSEAGELHLAGQPPMRAERRYLWRASAGRVGVLFADGRAFHDFDAGAARPGAVHRCPPDLYRVAYDFSAWPRWTAVWEVRGPRKDYRMVSRYGGA
jgi:hypothetical protein